MENRSANQIEQVATQRTARVASQQQSQAVEPAKGGGWLLPAMALVIAIVLAAVLMPLASSATGTESVAGRVLVTPVVIGSIALSLFSVLQGISRIANGPLLSKSARNWLQSSQSVPFETAVAGLALLASFAAWGWVFRDLLAADHQVFSERPEAAIYWSERLVPVWIPLLAGMFAMLMNQVSLYVNGVTVKKDNSGTIKLDDANKETIILSTPEQEQAKPKKPTLSKPDVTF